MCTSESPAGTAVGALAAIVLFAATTVAAAPLTMQATVAPGTPMDGEGNDLFGYSIAIDDDTLVVGAFSDEIEIIPGQGDSSSVGSVYVFRRVAQTWILEQRLIAADAEAQGWFGWDVAVRGNHLIVGAPQHDSPDPGTTANVIDQGAAYVYRRIGTA